MMGGRGGSSGISSGNVRSLIKSDRAKYQNYMDSMKTEAIAIGYIQEERAELVRKVGWNKEMAASVTDAVIKRDHLAEADKFQARVDAADRFLASLKK